MTALPAGATGQEVVAAIRRAAVAQGMTAIEFARPLSPQPIRWLKQLGEALQPRPATVARVDALLGGRPIPPDVQKLWRDSNPGAGVVQRGPELITAPVDRDPCWRCGVRGDLACGCREARRYG